MLLHSRTHERVASKKKKIRSRYSLLSPKAFRETRFLFFWTPPGFAWFFELPKEEHPIGAEHDRIKNNFHSCLRHSCHRVPASISAWAVPSLLKLPTSLKHLPSITSILIETMVHEIPNLEDPPPLWCCFCSSKSFFIPSFSQKLEILGCPYCQGMIIAFIHK